MALKDWKPEGNNLWIRKKFRGQVEIMLSIGKERETGKWFVNWGQSKTNTPFFDSRTKALAYAKKYMRRN